MDYKIKKGLGFIKKNPTIVYSLLLIVAVSAIIFFNTYYSVNKFQKNTDNLLHSKAILAEDIFNLSIAEEIENENRLKELVKKIKEVDSEIIKIEVLQPTEDNEKFKIIASTDESKIGIETEEQINFMAWRIPQGVAFLKSNRNGRFWRVVKIIQVDGNKKAVVAFDISLADNDALINQAIYRMYWVAILSLLVVLLLVINHARLFKATLRVTKLEEIDKMKDDFISIASHELRMPLTVIKGYADLLKYSLESEEGEHKSSEYKEKLHQLKNIELATERLGGLVNDILDVSRIEQGRMNIKKEKVNIAEIIKGIVDQFVVNAQNKKLTLSAIDLPTEMWVEADKERVKQIIINLIGNAIKYTFEGGISVGVEIGDEYIRVIVKDTGTGMSADSMKKLFSKFYRIKTKKTEKVSGTGLGLWISKELALKMGGDLIAESMENVGSQFILKIPKSKDLLKK